MASVLKTPWLPPPPKAFSVIQTHRHRNYCRIWESPEPIIHSQQNVCHLQHRDVTQMDVDFKEVSIGTVLQSLPCGAPTSTSTPPLPLDPLPSNVNDQRSISPILGTNTTKNLRIVSTSPVKISQTSSLTPQSLPSLSIALPPSPLSEDLRFYASPCPSQSPAHLEMKALSPTGSVFGSYYTSGDENNDTCMEDDDESPLVVPAKKVPLHPTPLLLRRRSLALNPALRELTSSKHTTTRCQAKRERNHLETGSSEDEKLVLDSPISNGESQGYNPVFTGESQLQTCETHGKLRNVDRTKSDLQSTPTQAKYVTYYGDAYPKDIDTPEYSAANHSLPPTHYTTIKREPSIIDLTEDLNDPTELQLHDVIHPTSLTATSASTSTVPLIINYKKNHTEPYPPPNSVVKPTLLKTKPPTKRQNSSIKSKVKSKPKYDEEKLPTIEHAGDMKYFCSVCNCTLNRSSDYRRHSWSNRHRAACNEPKITYECPYCQEVLCRSDALTRHVARSCRKRYSNTSTSDST